MAPPRGPNGRPCQSLSSKQRVTLPGRLTVHFLPSWPCYRALPRPAFCFCFLVPNGVLIGSGAVTSGTGMRGGGGSSIISTAVLGLKASKGENFTGLQNRRSSSADYLLGYRHTILLWLTFQSLLMTLLAVRPKWNSHQPRRSLGKGY